MQTNTKINDRRSQSISSALPNGSGLTFIRAKGAEIWDIENKRYIDFSSGIGVQNIGHCHPAVITAIKQQADQLIHQCFQTGNHLPYIELAEKLNKLAPGDSTKKTDFFNSGAEAVENAIKFAIANTNRHGVLAFHGGFHGRTFKALSLTSKPNPYKLKLGPMPGAVYHAAFPDEYHNISTDDALQSIENIFKYELAANDFAAMIIEPIQGEGGFRPAPQAFLSAIKDICDQNGILLIADEIQTGFGRTGKLFAIEHYNIEPDFITAAKSIANGLPLSAVIGKQELMDNCAPGSIGTTYGGNTLACRASLAVLDVLENENCYARANHIGAKIKNTLENIQQQNYGKNLGCVRVTGAMCAFEMVSDRKEKTPAPELTNKINQILQQNGLLTLKCGVYQNTIRMFPALTISDELLDEACEILTASFANKNI